MRSSATTMGIGCALLASGLACKPQVGDPPSLIAGPTLLAMRGEPAEAFPDQPVTYTLIAADLDGPIPAPNAVVTAPALWSICNVPKPPTETNAVNRACLDMTALPGAEGPTPTTFQAPMPDNACQLFGPQSPPVVGNAPAIRPRDPDVTGGYYLPVRVSLNIPEGLWRPGMATQDALVGFGLERIFCGLANAPGPIVPIYNQTYQPNQNPLIDYVSYQIGDGNAQLLEPAAGLTPSRPQIPMGSEVMFEAAWTEDVVESYPAYDVVARTLITHREAMRVSWYATSGVFDHDTTGRGEDETDLYTDNIWRPNQVGPLHLWVVLRDSRGGVDSAYYQFEVTP